MAVSQLATEPDDDELLELEELELEELELEDELEELDDPLTTPLELELLELDDDPLTKPLELDDELELLELEVLGIITPELEELLDVPEMAPLELDELLEVEDDELLEGSGLKPPEDEPLAAPPTLGLHPCNTNNPVASSSKMILFIMVNL